MSEIERRGGKSLLSSRSCEAEIPPGLQSPPKPSRGSAAIRRLRAGIAHRDPFPPSDRRQQVNPAPGTTSGWGAGGRGRGREQDRSERKPEGKVTLRGSPAPQRGAELPGGRRGVPRPARSLPARPPSPHSHTHSSTT